MRETRFTRVEGNVEKRFIEKFRSIFGFLKFSEIFFPSVKIKSLREFLRNFPNLLNKREDIYFHKDI